MMWGVENMEDNNQDQEWGFHAFIRGIILFGFTMLFISLISTGNIKYYIAPTMMPFIYFALVVFLVLSIVQIIRSTPKGQQEELECDCGTNHTMSGSRWKKITIYSIFIVPLLMGFMLPDKVLDSSVAAMRGVQLGSGIYSKPAAIERIESNQLKKQSESGTERADQFLNDINSKDGEEIEHYTVEDTLSYDGFDDYYTELAKELMEKDLVIVEDVNFLDIMTVMDIYQEDFIGKTVEIMGFVYREPGMKMDELVVARFSMTCCTADSAVYGLLVKGEDTRQFENDTWIRVKGKIDITEFNGWMIPMLHLEEALEVPKPDSPYVYPRFY
jgi:putative membrane protein